MNRPGGGDPLRMAHLMNVLCATVLIYASVTRGGVAVARGLQFVLRKAR
jgi:hypothetical protein